MSSFVDSSEIVSDGPALAARMAEDGYLFIKGLVPCEPIAAERRKALRVAADCGWLKPDTAPDDALANPDAACVDPDDPYVAVLRRIYRSEGLHALKHHQSIVGLFERMLGGPVLAHPMLISRNIFPRRDEFTTPPHQDYVHIQGAPETFTVWLPLSDCPPEMGGIEVARGSHRDGVRDFAVTSGAGAMAVSEPLDGRWVGGGFELGDALVFHSMAVHRGRPNRSSLLRQSIDARYQLASEPVAPKSLDPYSGMGTWDEIYEGWTSDAFKYYWRSMSLDVVPFDWQYYERRDEMAFDMASQGDPTCRAALQRIVQRDPDATKRARASQALAQLQ